MKKTGIVVIAILILIWGAAAGALGGALIAEQMQTKTDSTRAEAQATFTGNDEATIEFPAYVRGRMVHCVVVVNTKRRASAVFC